MHVGARLCNHDRSLLSALTGFMMAQVPALLESYEWHHIALYSVVRSWRLHHKTLEPPGLRQTVRVMLSTVTQLVSG